MLQLKITASLVLSNAFFFFCKDHCPGLLPMMSYCLCLLDNFLPPKALLFLLVTLMPELAHGLGWGGALMAQFSVILT